MRHFRLSLLTGLFACQPGKTGDGSATPGPTDSPADTGRPDTPEDTDPAREIDTSIESVPTACEDGRWPDVRLNEWVAANRDGLADAAGDAVDWLEIVNRSGADVDLDGWSLQNADGERWTFAPLVLSDDEIQLIWASGAASQGDPDLGEEVHAGIKIDAFQAAVALVAPDGCVVDEADGDRLYGDVSFGRAGDDPDAWEYFLEPTPGAENSTESRPGFASVPVISPGSGFLSTRNEVTIHSDQAGATLYYTTDATEPDDEDTRYTEPFEVLATEDAGVVRAIATVDDLWPSRVATATLFGNDDALDAGMYTFSLVVEPDDLWSDETGIYAYGADDYEHWYPYFGANFWERWERDVHVSVWNASGDLIIDQDAGIEVHGGYTRAFDQKSFRIMARSAYGPETFAGKLFDSEDLDEFETLVLQIGMDWCSTHIQEVVPTTLMRDADGRQLPAVDMPAWAPAQVWLNGEYWGYYNLRERPDDAWLAQHHGVDRTSLDRVELGWTHDPNWELEQGTWDAFDAMNDFVVDADLSDEATWESFDAMVDVDSLASVVLLEGYMANTDWWWNNLRLWRPATDDGQWRWVALDWGHGWANPGYDHFETSVDWTGDGLPIADALENDKFRALIANQTSDYLNTVLSAENAAATLEAVAARVEPAMEGQFARWCPSYPSTAWDSAIANARFFVDKRPDNLRNQVGKHLGLDTTVLLRLETDPAGAGSFELTAVTVPAPFEGTYYADVPIPITAVPADGYRFVGWEDSSLGSDARVEVELSADQTLTAVFEVD